MCDYFICTNMQLGSFRIKCFARVCVRGRGEGERPFRQPPSSLTDLAEIKMAAVLSGLHVPTCWLTCWKKSHVNYI